MSWQSSQTAADRFFACLPYLLPIVEVYSFGRFIFQQFPIVQNFYLPLAPLAMVNSSPFGGFLLFFLLYLGVVMNPRISRFIRFNALQSILIGILISLCGLIFSYILKPLLPVQIVIEVLMNVIFLGTIAACVYGIICSALGKYAEIPQLSDAAYIQIDRY
jgi:uncharacterized membrane protein